MQSGRNIQAGTHKSTESRKAEKRPRSNTTTNQDYAPTKRIRLFQNTQANKHTEIEEKELKGRPDIFLHEPDHGAKNMTTSDLINTKYIGYRSNGWKVTRCRDEYMPPTKKRYKTCCVAKTRENKPTPPQERTPEHKPRPKGAGGKKSHPRRKRKSQKYHHRAKHRMGK